MNLTFRRLSDRRKVDLIPYIEARILEAIDQDLDVKIYIGTDSQNAGKNTIYASVIILHYGNTGGHVLYSKKTIPRVYETFTRLFNEVVDSLEVAEYLYQNGLPKADYIDLDLNPDPVYRSNSVLRSALGYVNSMGYKARIKPNAPAASSVADAICH